MWSELGRTARPLRRGRAPLLAAVGTRRTARPGCFLGMSAMMQARVQGIPC